MVMVLPLILCRLKLVLHLLNYKITAIKAWLIRCVFILLDFNINKPLE